MKKQKILIGLVALLLSSGAMLTSIPTIEASARRVDYIGYVSSSEKPIIDGTIDTIWEDAGSLATSNGYASVLWNESGIYYLAYVYDNSICAKDSCAFWICEDYSLNNAWIEYYSGGGGYDEDGKSGAYYVKVTAGGEITASCTKSEKYQQIESAVSQGKGYWVVEIFVPHIGEKTRLAEHERIGFEFTIDGYDSMNDPSVSRSKWMSNNNWPYSTDHTALGKLVLSKSNEEVAVAPKTDSEITSTSDKNSGSCGSVISSNIALVSGLGALCLFIKKDDKYLNNK